MRLYRLICRDTGLRHVSGRRAFMCFSVLCIVLLQVGCGGQSGVQAGDAGIYRFISHPIEVLEPGRCLLDQYVTSSEQMIGFTTGRGFWDANGRYALHVFPLPAEVVDTASFEARAERFFKKFLVGEPDQFGVRVVPVSQSPQTVDDSPALRAIAIDPGRAIFVATARLHATRITVASLLFPLSGVESPETQLPWSCYERFVESVRELTPG